VEAPENDAEENATVLGSVEQTTARVLGAADLAVARAREAAGNRLKSLAKRDPDCLTLIEGVRPSLVAHVLGPERAAALGAPAAFTLVAGARDIVLDALRMQDIEGPLAERIADTIEVWAARTLYEEYPGGLPLAFGNLIAEANGDRPTLTPA
jgi:hypothetical protein